MGDPRYRALAEAALDVGRRRAIQLDEIRLVLIRGDHERALALMRVYTGINEDENEKEGDSSDPGLH